MAKLEHWIGGRFQAINPTRFLPIRDPAIGEKLVELCCASSEDILQAIAAAEAALPIWQDTAPQARVRILTEFSHILESRRAELADAITREHGKTLSDAHSEIQRGLEMVHFALSIPHLLQGQCHQASCTDIHNVSANQSVGICLAITPYSFPVLAPLWTLPIALACGNTYILKPSEKTPSPALLLAQWLAEAGLPPGVFNVVLGDHISAQQLLSDPRISAVTFAGSTDNAQFVYQQAASYGKRVQALGSAKNHVVVMPDADMSFAAKAISQGAWGLTGQRCMAVSVAVAVGDACAEQLIESLKQHAQAIRVGPGISSCADMGPLVSEDHLGKVLTLIKSGELQGAHLAIDGREINIPGYETGYFCGPCLFDQVTPNMSIYREEIFGPVLCIVRVDTLHDAIQLINQNRYGNGAAIFTQNAATANRFETEVDVGMVGINVAIPAPSAHFSLGGWKASMFGDLHFHGEEGIKFFTRTKIVSRRWISDANTANMAQNSSLHTH